MTVESKFMARLATRAGILLAMTLPVQVIAEAQGTDGAALFRSLGCVACHGADGSHPVSETYPVIVGQNAEYLLRQMKDIRDGRRTNGLSETMRAVVAEARDEDLAVIAEWLSNRW